MVRFKLNKPNTWDLFVDCYLLQALYHRQRSVHCSWSLVMALLKHIHNFLLFVLYMELQWEGYMEMRLLQLLRIDPMKLVALFQV